MSLRPYGMYFNNNVQMRVMKDENYRPDLQRVRMPKRALKSKMDSILLRAWSFNPEKRQTCKVLAEEIQEIWKALKCDDLDVLSAFQFSTDVYCQSERWFWLDDVKLQDEKLDLLIDFEIL